MTTFTVTSRLLSLTDARSEFVIAARTKLFTTGATFGSNLSEDVITVAFFGTTKYFIT